MTDVTGATPEDKKQHTIGNEIDAKDWTSDKVDAYLEIVLDNVQQIRQVYSDTLARGQSLLGFEGVILALTGAAVTGMAEILYGNVPALVLLFASVALITISIVLSTYSSIKSQRIKDAVLHDWDRLIGASDSREMKIAFASALVAVYGSHKDAIHRKARLIDFSLYVLITGLAMLTLGILLIISEAI